MCVYMPLMFYMCQISLQMHVPLMYVILIMGNCSCVQGQSSLWNKHTLDNLKDVLFKFSPFSISLLN